MPGPAAARASRQTSDGAPSTHARDGTPREDHVLFNDIAADPSIATVDEMTRAVLAFIDCDVAMSDAMSDMPGLLAMDAAVVRRACHAATNVHGSAESADTFDRHVDEQILDEFCRARPLVGAFSLLSMARATEGGRSLARAMRVARDRARAPRMAIATHHADATD